MKPLACVFDFPRGPGDAQRPGPAAGCLARPPPSNTTIQSDGLRGGDRQGPGRAAASAGPESDSLRALCRIARAVPGPGGPRANIRARLGRGQRRLGRRHGLRTRGRQRAAGASPVTATKGEPRRRWRRPRRPRPGRSCPAPPLYEAEPLAGGDPWGPAQRRGRRCGRMRAGGRRPCPIIPVDLARKPRPRFAETRRFPRPPAAAESRASPDEIKTMPFTTLLSALIAEW